MNPTDGQDWLDSLLRQPQASIEDGGFARRVLAALPARPPRTRLRTLVLMTATATACLLGLFALPAGDFAFEALGRLASTETWQSPALALSSLVAALAAVFGGLSAAIFEA